MGPLSDYIPLSSDDFIPIGQDHNMTVNEEDDNPRPFVGLSHDIGAEASENAVVKLADRKFVVQVSDDDNGEQQETVPDTACETTMDLSSRDCTLLLSTTGSEFLKKLASSLQISTRFTFTLVGQALKILGSPSNQNSFWDQLVTKLNSLKHERRELLREFNTNVPKRAWPLIRFLRENLQILAADLGNPQTLVRSLKYFDKLNSKTGTESVKKIVRLLNMILIGQAGFLSGDVHVGKLVHHLKELLANTSIDDDYSEIVPVATRHDIELHYNLVFSSYRHEDYYSLTRKYFKLASKDHVKKPQIDPSLLGHKVFDTSSIAEQEDAERPTSANLKPNPINLMRRKSLASKMPTASTKAAAAATTATVERRVGLPIRVSESRLAAIYADHRGVPNTRLPSKIWSRFGMKYVTKMLALPRVAQGSSIKVKLEQLREKCLQQKLSHGQYFSLMKLHYWMKNACVRTAAAGRQN